MRSAFTRIVLSLLGAFVLCLSMITATSWTISRMVRREDPFSRSLALQLGNVRRAFEAEGPDGLRREFHRIDEFFPPSQRFLLDERNRDVLTGDDHSALAGKAHSPGTLPRFLGGGQPLIYRSADKKYAYVVLPNLPPPIWPVVPYAVCILIVIALLAWIFSRALVSPLRKLRDTVDRFGRGDLAARTGSTRQDEFGEVSRAFDDMAARIETLLTAERRLLQDVSHELRTPLARLGFAVELARTSSDREASLSRIRKEVDRLSGLVGQLLQVTRAEGDPASREMEDVALDELVREVAEDSSWEAELRHVRIVSRVDDSSVVRGDREILRRAVENIVRNAVRHAPEGSSVEIGLDKERGHAHIRVRDAGPGVAEENLEQIFKPFFREDSSRNAATGGLGLGLAIASRAVHLHHGKVRATNVHPGLLIEIELPVAA